MDRRNMKNYFSLSTTCHWEGPVSNTGQDCDYLEVDFYNLSNNAFCPKLNFFFQFLTIHFYVYSARPTQPFIQWILGSFSPKIKRSCGKGNHSNNLVPCLRMGGAVP